MWWVHNANICLSEAVEVAKRIVKRRPKVPAEAVLDEAGNLTEYGKWYYERPNGFRKGVRDNVWKKAEEAEGRVKDPLTGNALEKTSPGIWAINLGTSFVSTKKVVLKDRSSEKSLWMNITIPNITDLNHPPQTVVMRVRITQMITLVINS